MSDQTELFKLGIDRIDKAIALVSMLKAASHAPDEYFPDLVLIHDYSTIMFDELQMAREFFDLLALKAKGKLSKKK